MAIQANPRQNPSDVVLQERRKLPIEVAVQIVPVSQTRSLQRHAASARPSKVSSLHDLHLMINQGGYQGYTGGGEEERFTSWFCPKFNSVLIASRRLLRTIPAAKMIHADATYRVIPHLSSQLLCICANWGNYVSNHGPDTLATHCMLFARRSQFLPMHYGKKRHFRWKKVESAFTPAMVRNVFTRHGALEK